MFPEGWDLVTAATQGSFILGRGRAGSAPIPSSGISVTEAEFSHNVCVISYEALEGNTVMENYAK